MIWVVLKKEVRDSLRDRRSLIFALIYGPFLMPALMLAPTLFYSGKQADSQYSVQQIHISGIDRAPNLVSYLRSKNIDATAVQGDFTSAIEKGEYQLVIEVSEEYGENLLNGSPARLDLHYASGSTASRELFFTVMRTLNQYGSETLAQRMFARGISQELLRPIQLDAHDVSITDPYLDVIARMIIFLGVFSIVMGAFYSAIDIVAGEREKKTLESLLSMPIHRLQLLAGKYLTILLFSAFCGVTSILNAFVWLRLLPDSFYGTSDVPGLFTLFGILVLCLPISVCLSGLLLLLSTLSKTVKEAQTQLGFVMLLVMSPFLVIQFLEGDLPAVLACIPVLGQYIHGELFIFDSTYSLSNALLVSIASVVAGALFFYSALLILCKDDYLS